MQDTSVEGRARAKNKTKQKMAKKQKKKKKNDKDTIWHLVRLNDFLQVPDFYWEISPGIRGKKKKCLHSAFI